MLLSRVHIWGCLVSNLTRSRLVCRALRSSLIHTRASQTCWRIERHKNRMREFSYSDIIRVCQV